MIQKDLLKVKMSLMSSKIPVDQLNQCPAKCFDRLFGMDLKLKVSKSIRKILVNNSMRQLFAPGWVDLLFGICDLDLSPVLRK